jgi:hypothetical protein
MALARERSGEQKGSQDQGRAFEKPSEAFRRSRWCSVHKPNIALALEATSEGFGSLQAQNPVRRQGFIPIHADSIDANLFIIFHMIALLSKMQGKRGLDAPFVEMAGKHSALRASNHAGGA